MPSEDLFQTSTHVHDSTMYLLDRQFCEAWTVMPWWCVQARRLPKEVLVSVVRPQFQPQEYPASLTRLYNWSPDEAIPEFYSDASVFESIHPELLDMTLPDWAASPHDFVTRHRCLSTFFCCLRHTCVDL